jgi:hypothetical protein
MAALTAGPVYASAAAASPWQTEATPNPAGQVNGSLAGVSCGSAEDCLAVGQYFNDRGTVLPLAETWNGTKWTRHAVTAPPRSTSSQLSSVSCTSADNCVAAGFANVTEANVSTPLAEGWNGRTWSIQPTVAPGGAAYSVLSGVSCSAPDACTAVGYYTNSSGSSFTLAERWNGTTWSLQASVQPAGAADGKLLAVACDSADSCVATGASATVAGFGDAKTLAEVWNGKKWALQSTSNRPFANASELTGVWCAKVCTATGYNLLSSGATQPLVEHWSGGPTWNLQTTPIPGGASYSQLTGLWCSSADACTAVGSYGGNISAAKTLAERWNGTAWSIQATPNRSGSTDSELAAVACPTTGTCVAAGSVEAGDGDPVPLAEGRSGGAWSLQSAVIPTGASQSQLFGVSCPSTQSCEAVGSYTVSSVLDQTLAEVWNGTTWSVQATPNPATSTDGVLQGISCPTAGDCEAVGYYYPSTGSAMPLAETWNGTKWAIQPVPSPSGGQRYELSSVSCSSASACTAVGAYNLTSGAQTQVAFAERWNGKTWAPQTLPKVAAVTSFAAVSCGSASDCEAVGSYSTSTGEPLALAEGWNGSTWAMQKVPAVSGSQGASLDGVSCTAADSTVPDSTGTGACTATGTDDTTQTSVSLAVRWNGKSWQVQTTPNPPAAAASITGVTLGSVSCTSPSACDAIGSYTTDENTPAAFAESWNGSSWSLQNTAVPFGAMGTTLAAISCIPARCAAVGSYFGTGDVTVTLAMARSLG